MSTPAGWYPDPHDSSQERWWNGTSWSEAWQPRGGTPPSDLYGPPVVAAPAPTHGSAALALVLGIVGLVMCGLFTGIPAMVVGRRATRDIDQSGGRLGGRGLATAGFWTGLVATAWSGLVAVAFVGLLVFATVSPTPDDETCTVYPDGTSSGC